MEAYGSFDGSSTPSSDFADRVPFYGAVVACVDDAAVRALLPTLARRVITYGFCGGRRRARTRARDRRRVRTLPASATASAASPSATARGELELACPAATTCRTRWRRSRSASSSACRSIGSARALAEFRGAERRYQTARRGARRPRHRRLRPSSDRDCRRARAPRATASRAARRGVPAPPVHAHARPARATSVRRWPPPTSSCSPTSTPAGEAPIPGVTLDALADAVRPSVAELHVVPTLDDVPRAVARLARAGRSGRHARRRLDRRRRAIASSTALGRGGGRVMSRAAETSRAACRPAGVAAPADRRFRRSGLRPEQRRVGRTIAARGQVDRPALAVVAAAGFWLTGVVLHARMLTVQHVARARQRPAVGRRRRGAGRRHPRREHLPRRLRARTGSGVLDSPWVADVALSRVLPSTIEVRVVERTPMAIARLGQQLYLVDDAGVIIDEYGAAVSRLRPADRRRSGVEPGGDGPARRSRARAADGGVSRGARRRGPICRSGCRRWTCRTRTTSS